MDRILQKTLRMGEWGIPGIFALQTTMGPRPFVKKGLLRRDSHREGENVDLSKKEISSASRLEEKENTLFYGF